jgi:hypothetical protein
LGDCKDEDGDHPLRKPKNKGNKIDRKEDASNNNSDHTDYPNYNARESAMQAAGLGINWLLEVGPETYIFTESSSLTMDIMASPGMNEFREVWAEEDFRVPFSWKHTTDNRDEGLSWRNIGIFLRDHFGKNILTQVGLGSRTAEGQIDSVGGIIGSLDTITVDKYDDNHVIFAVHNEMGWASGTRLPGTRNSLFPNRPRSPWGLGGTIQQVFIWIEPSP